MAAVTTNKIMHLYCIDSTGTLKYKYDKLEVQSFDSSVFLEIDDLAPDQYVLKVLQDGGVELVQVHLADYITDEELDHILVLNMSPAVNQYPAISSLPASNPPDTNGDAGPPPAAPATPNDEEKSSWTRESTGQLIALYEEMLDLFARTRRKNVVWCELAERLREEHGLAFTGEQCHRKWRNILKTYRETLDRKKSGTGKVVWPYFDTMQNLVERTANQTPVLGVEPSTPSTTSGAAATKRRPGLIMLPPPPAFLSAAKPRAAESAPLGADPQNCCRTSPLPQQPLPQPPPQQQQQQQLNNDPRLCPAPSPPPPLTFMSVAAAMPTSTFMTSSNVVLPMFDERMVIKKEEDDEDASCDAHVEHNGLGGGGVVDQQAAAYAAAAARKRSRKRKAMGEDCSPSAVHEQSPPDWFKNWLEEERESRREAAEREQRSAELLQTTANHLLSAVLECKTILSSIRDNR